MTIHYEPSRSGFIVNPPAIDEATGESYGEPQVFDNAPFGQDQWIGPDPNQVVVQHEPESTFDSYANVLIDSYPVDAIIAHAEATRPKEYLEKYNDLIDSQSMDFMGMFEEMAKDYQDNGQVAEPEITQDQVDFVSSFEPEVSQDSERMVLETDLSSYGDAGIVVQSLAHKVVSGQLTTNAAMQEAMQSGINPLQLYSAYHALYKNTN